MKKYSLFSKALSILLTVAILSSCLAVMSYADEEYDAWDEGMTMWYWKEDKGGHSLLRVGFSEKYVRFGENVTVEVFFGKESKTFSGDELLSVREEGYYYDAVELEQAIYIKDAVSCAPSKVVVAENSVYDAEENGNSPITIEGYSDREFYFFKIQNVEDSVYLDETECYIGDGIRCNSPIPVDFYMNDELVSQNTSSFEYLTENEGKYVFSAKKMGIVLYTREFTVKKLTSADKVKHYLELILFAPVYLFVESVLAAITFSFISTIIGTAGIFGPFVAIRDLFEKLFSNN